MDGVPEGDVDSLIRPTAYAAGAGVSGLLMRKGNFKRPPHLFAPLPPHALEGGRDG